MAKLAKIFTSIILLCVLILTYLGILSLIFFRKKDMPFSLVTANNCYEAFILLKKEYNIAEPEINKREYRNFIEQDIGLKFYIYVEKNINSEYVGITYATIRTIIIDKNVFGYEYCVTFAHEAIHLKQFIGQENYVCFETFKYLYESEKLHSVGVWYGIKQLEGYYNGDYNISGEIVNYLTQK